jgi:hypothetical protein
MSMPLCGLRDWPLKTRRRPKLLERRPGTGTRMCRLPEGGGSVKVAITVFRWAASRS